MIKFCLNVSFDPSGLKFLLPRFYHWVDSLQNLILKCLNVTLSETNCVSWQQLSQRLCTPSAAQRHWLPDCTSSLITVSRDGGCRQNYPPTVWLCLVNSPLEKGSKCTAAGLLILDVSLILELSWHNERFLFDLRSSWSRFKLLDLCVCEIWSQQTETHGCDLIFWTWSTNRSAKSSREGGGCGVHDGGQDRGLLRFCWCVLLLSPPKLYFLLNIEAVGQQ